MQAAVYHDSDTGDGNTIASVTASGNFGGSTKVFRTTYTPNALGQVVGNYGDTSVSPLIAPQNSALSYTAATWNYGDTSVNP